MARRAAQSMVKRASAQVESLAAPVGGWNVRDSLANMDPMDAVQLDNLFPTVSNVELRGGYTRFATGLPGQVETLMAFTSGTASKFFGIVAGGSIYDVSTAGAVGAPAVTGLSNGRFEYINITTPGGSFMPAVNGLDNLQLYNGTTWQTVTAISAPISITGVDTSTLSNVILWKHRLWFIQKNTLKAWYLPIDSVGGAAQMLDLSTLARDGGALVDMDTWTIDAGYGMDDNLVFMTNQGEVIIYRGTDPASAATFALIGVWEMGSPVGNRCLLKFGGDLLMLTYDGLLPMAQALQSDRVNPQIALSDKINGAINDATTLYHSNFGWQIGYTAKNNAVFVNVPISVGGQQQYVMNTITKSWCRFIGWAANCWEVYGDEPYFGGNGYVAHAWDVSYADDTAAIQTNGLQAFNYFEKRGVKKYFTRAHLAIFTDGTPSIGVGINVDFDTSDTTAALSFVPVAYGLWDTGTWDTSIWASGLQISNTWLGVTGIGYCGGLHFKTASSGVQIQWASTDVVYQTGWSGV